MSDQITFTLVDDETEAEFVFTELFRFVEDTKFNKTYIVLYRAVDDDDDEIQAFVFDETLTNEAPENGLLPIETEEEWEMIEEMINTFFDEPEMNS